MVFCLFLALSGGSLVILTVIQALIAYHAFESSNQVLKKQVYPQDCSPDPFLDIWV